MALIIRQFPCLQDNYGYLIHDEATGQTATIDTPDTEAINAALTKEGWRLNAIWNTHHHWDHAGGNLALKEQWNCRVVGPRGEQDKIPGIDDAVGEGDTVLLGDSKAVVHDTPGHTLGHVIYHFEDDGAAFVGDTIFALGCGRLFEGTPKQMWASLSIIANMPPSTELFCAHEYTQANAKFALSIEPNNQALSKRARQIDERRAANEPTVPMTVADELETSPFLRADDPQLAAALNMSGARAVDVFAEVRRRKDAF